jgi:hypothetical protein
MAASYFVVYSCVISSLTSMAQNGATFQCMFMIKWNFEIWMRLLIFDICEEKEIKRHEKLVNSKCLKLNVSRYSSPNGNINLMRITLQKILKRNYFLQTCFLFTSLRRVILKMLINFIYVFYYDKKGKLG